MVKEIGVFNTPPVYVLGLMTLPEFGGYAFETVKEPLDWIRQHLDSALLIGVRSGRDLSVMMELRAERPDAVLVGLIHEWDLDTVRDSLAVGASAVVSRDADPADVALGLRAALADSTLIPSDLAHGLATVGPKSRPACLEDIELSWLRLLAGSTTVASLGEAAGYSEREMYRRLKKMYYKMGVGSRTEALIMASRLGWIQ